MLRNRIHFIDLTCNWCSLSGVRPGALSCHIPGKERSSFTIAPKFRHSLFITSDGIILGSVIETFCWKGIIPERKLDLVGGDVGQRVGRQNKIFVLYLKFMIRLVFCSNSVPTPNELCDLGEVTHWYNASQRLEGESICKWEHFFCLHIDEERHFCLHRIVKMNVSPQLESIFLLIVFVPDPILCSLGNSGLFLIFDACCLCNSQLLCFIIFAWLEKPQWCHNFSFC